MGKYIINENIHGYDKVTVNDDKFTEDADSDLILLIDKSCDNNLALYYRAINKCLKNRFRIFLFSVKDQNKLLKPLASLLITYNDYDIYEIADRNALSVELITTAKKRNPDFTEVQTFLGGDIVAYSDMSDILYGIESIINEGNIDALKTFVEQHMISIESITSVLNSMKKTSDLFNSDELIEEINKLKKDIDNSKGKIDELNGDITNTKSDRDKYKAESENLKIQMKQLQNTNEQLKSQNDSAGSVIKTYKETNTAIIKCTTKIIVYFKEISYVQYMNSLVINLMSFLEMRKLNTKLLVYDTNAGLYDQYKPLPIITGKEFESQKETLIRKTKKFVVAEPNQVIIESILTSDECFDVVIIYDRMRGVTDLVSGNLVTKYFVINSSSDYDALALKLNIIDSSNIITHYGSSLVTKASQRNIKLDDKGHANYLDIPYIEDYAKATDSAKENKYMKLQTQQSKQPLVMTILKKTRISEIM